MNGQTLVYAAGTNAAPFSMGGFIPQALDAGSRQGALSVWLRVHFASVTGLAVWAGRSTPTTNWPPVEVTLTRLALAAATLGLKLDHQARAFDEAEPA